MATAAPSSPSTGSSWAHDRKGQSLGARAHQLSRQPRGTIGGYYALKKLFPDWNDGLVLGIAAGPLVLTLLTITLPAWLRQRRDRKLVQEGIGGALDDPEYFRIWPYESRDRDRYSRPDKAHEDVLR